MEQLCKFRIPGEVRQVMDAVVRKTYGWNKKADLITLAQFVELTGLDKPNICRALSKLITHNIIKTDNGSYALQKDFEAWIPFGIIKTDNPAPIIKTDNVIIKSDNESLSKAIIPVIKSDNALHINQKTLSKDNTKDTISKDIFIHWNSLGIMAHQKLTNKFQSAISASLKEHSAEELCKAMSNYAEIVLSPAYYFKHRWTIGEFLARGIEKFLDGEIARQNYRIKNKPNEQVYPGDKFKQGKYAHMVQR